MKKFFAWLLRFCCIAVILFAAYTLAICLRNVNKDYSAEAVLGTTEIKTFESENYTMDSTPVQEQALVEAVVEDPTVKLTAEGSATVDTPTVVVTAAFGDIVNSITADLSWYLDGKLIHEDKDCLLMDGSTVDCDAVIRVTRNSNETAEVSLTVAWEENTAEAMVEIPVELPDEKNHVVVRSQEIPVTATEEVTMYGEKELKTELDTAFGPEDTSLLLDYDTDSEGDGVLQLQLPNGIVGWVHADAVEVSQEDCTTDTDYTTEEKEDFVNSMNYESSTSQLIWVNLYTQKVNVFTGYRGHWTLEESFSCASGVNSSPTTRGIFDVDYSEEKWDLGDTYVAPILRFNGGEAFTSQPYDSKTDEVADDTMGKPASSGGVRLLQKDVQWLVDNIKESTTVVVY